MYSKIVSTRETTQELHNHDNNRVIMTMTMESWVTLPEHIVHILVCESVSDGGQ